ncbi:TPA: hypothetical protein ACH3X3_014153 [Trebouxia sp. C0006]
MARNGAQIITQARNSSQPPGNVMRSMIRVHVVLTQQAGQVQGSSTRLTSCHTQALPCLCGYQNPARPQTKALVAPVTLTLGETTRRAGVPCWLSTFGKKLFWLMNIGTTM